VPRLEELSGELLVALQKIHGDKLYRAEFGTFEDYCRDRLSRTDRRVRQLFDALKVWNLVPEIENERQARELTEFLDEPETARAIYAEAKSQADVEGTKLTSKTIHKAKEKVTGRKPKPRSRAQVVTQEAGEHRLREASWALLEAWQPADRLRGRRGALAGLRGRVRGAREGAARPA
jgi:hypothetical protein